MQAKSTKGNISNEGKHKTSYYYWTVGNKLIGYTQIILLE